jgi:hypothetical protein
MTVVTLPAPLAQLAAENRLSLPLVVRAGSKSYGIDVEGSDDDYVGVFVAPLGELLSMSGLARDTYAANDPDYTLHEIGKFCRLALQGNPAILETLWNPDVVARDPWGDELVALRGRMLHRGSLQVYLDYAEAQMRKMVKGSGLHAKGGTYNGKFGAHLIRLLHAGLRLGETGEVMVRVPADLASTLLEIRSGGASMEKVLALARPLADRLKKLTADNVLPAAADVDAVNDLVVRARLARRDA